jgi:hypothetical protein
MVAARWRNCPYMGIVREIFPEHVISLRGELPWLVPSPDLSACDYFLSGCLKIEMYSTRQRTINELMMAIRKKISAIPENVARRAVGNPRARLEVCVRNDGQHFSDVLFKTK